MKNCLLSLEKKIFLRKPSIVETVFDYLKNKLQLEHSRHRSPVNAFIVSKIELGAAFLKFLKYKIQRFCRVDVVAATTKIAKLVYAAIYITEKSAIQQTSSNACSSSQLLCRIICL